MPFRCAHTCHIIVIMHSVIGRRKEVSVRNNMRTMYVWLFYQWRKNPHTNFFFTARIALHYFIWNLILRFTMIDIYVENESYLFCKSSELFRNLMYLDDKLSASLVFSFVTWFWTTCKHVMYLFLFFIFVTFIYTVIYWLFWECRN